MVGLNRYAERGIEGSIPDIGGRTSVMPEPSAVISALSAYMSSTAARSPAMAPTLLPIPEVLIAAATALKASSQLAGRSLPLTRTYGRSRRCDLRPSQTWRVLSEIHSSFTASLTRGRMRMTSRPRLSTRMLEPTASMTSMDSVFTSSHGRAWKA